MRLVVTAGSGGRSPAYPNNQVRCGTPPKAGSTAPPVAARTPCSSSRPNYFERREEKNAREAVAKSFCARCPVRDVCLEYALASREAHGIWGGLNEMERRRLLRERARAPAEIVGPTRPSVRGCAVMDDERSSRASSELGLELPPPPKAVASYVPVARAPRARVRRGAGADDRRGGDAPRAARRPRRGREHRAGRRGGPPRRAAGALGAARGARLVRAARRHRAGDRLHRRARRVRRAPDGGQRGERPARRRAGRAGRHARAAVGMASLPLGASVEVAVTAELG